MILVTGFEPWGTICRNPSGDFAQWANGQVLADMPIAGRRLPVCWDGAFEALVAAVTETRPIALLMLGVAAREGLHFERWAHNFAGGQADALGQCRSAGPIVVDAPPRLASTLPDLQIGSSPLSLHLSDHAGDYLCNYLYFRVMHSLGEIPWRGFVHVPPYSADDAPRGAKPSALLRGMLWLVEALVIAIGQDGQGPQGRQGPQGLITPQA